MIEETLNSYSLNPTLYESLFTCSGTITGLGNDEYIITTDDNVDISVIMHPKILESYNEKNHPLDIDDEVDVLGCFITLNGETKILILRCVVYEKPPTLLS